MTMTIAGAFQAQNENNRQWAKDRATSVKDFNQMNAPAFQGETDPLVAEDWLEQTVKALNVMRLDDDATRNLLATYNLKGPTE